MTSSSLQRNACAYFLIGIMTSLLLVLASCGTFETVKEAVGLEKTTPDGEKVVRFSEASQYPHLTQRKYERMNKSRLEEESALGSDAGSTWKMDGQGSYLFTQNKMRKEGDFLNLKLDGSAQKQVDLKVDVIKKLLKQLEELERGRQGNVQAREPAAAPAAAPAAPPADGAKADEKAETTAIGPVPSKVVERLADGSLRVRGQQTFMVNNKEFKVLVAGILRAEDFNDEMVSTDKLLDTEVDVVSLRKKDDGK